MRPVRPSASFSRAVCSGPSCSQRPVTTSAGAGSRTAPATTGRSGTAAGRLSDGHRSAPLALPLVDRGRAAGAAGAGARRRRVGEVHHLARARGAVAGVEHGDGVQVVAPADRGLPAAGDRLQQEAHGAGERGGELARHLVALLVAGRTAVAGDHVPLGDERAGGAVDDERVRPVAGGRAPVFGGVRDGPAAEGQRHGGPVLAPRLQLPGGAGGGVHRGSLVPGEPAEAVEPVHRHHGHRQVVRRAPPARALVPPHGVQLVHPHHLLRWRRRPPAP